MSADSFRGNVPAALEELRQARSGGVLVWFFELLWAHCSESRGIHGSASRPGVQNPARTNSKVHGPQVNPQWQQSINAVSSASMSKRPSNSGGVHNEHKKNNENSTSGGGGGEDDAEEDPDEFGGGGGSSMVNRPHRNMDSTAIFGEWDEDPDALIGNDDGTVPHDDFLWLPVLPPTVLLNFSRLQAWYFTPHTRMQLQREIAFYSVADDAEAAAVAAAGGGGAMFKATGRHPAPNDFEAHVAQLRKKTDQMGRRLKNQREGGGNINSSNNHHHHHHHHHHHVESQNSGRDVAASNFGTMQNENSDGGGDGGGGDAESNNTQPLQRRGSEARFARFVDLPEPERTLTLGQRQCLGIRRIAERFKREHSSNADELPAPVLKRLRGRLSTAVIVEAFEREYSQGLKVELMSTSGGSGGGNSHRADNNTTNNNSSNALVSSSVLSWTEEDETTKKKRKHEVRHYPSGWICPEGPDALSVRYDRIVAQLFLKQYEGGTGPEGYSAAGAKKKTKVKRSTGNNSGGTCTAMSDADDDVDMIEEDQRTLAGAGGDAALDFRNKYAAAGGGGTRGAGSRVSTLPSAAETAQMLSASLCAPKVEYLTMEGLRRVLCSGTLGQAALLQQFVPPPPPTAIGHARYNETLYFRWQPRWRYLERCTNSHSLDDYTVPAEKRGPTFEGPPGSSHSAMLGHATLYRLERACRAIVRHVFSVSQRTARILRLHCVFKMDEKMTLVLQCVVEAYAVNPRAVPPPTSIPNIVQAQAHLPRVRSTSAGPTTTANQKQQQQQQQQQQVSVHDHDDDRHHQSSNNVNPMMSNNNNNNNVNSSGAVTNTGWVPVPLDDDDIRQSPIRAVAAMSRGEARHAAVRRTMHERVLELRARQELQMMPDTQGVVKPVEEMRALADAAFARMNPKAAKTLSALFACRDRRRQLMRAGNESAFDVSHLQQNSSSGASGTKPSNSSTPAASSAQSTTPGVGFSGVRQLRSVSSPAVQQNNNSMSASFTPSFAVAKPRQRRTANPMAEATETIDDLTWGRQSQLSRALLRPVASRDDANKLPFHRRPVRSLAAECGSSGVGERYIGTMRNAATPDPHRKLTPLEVVQRRAFC